MAISLVKGEKVDLTKSNPGLSKIKIGLGWDTNKYDGGHGFDLDSCIALVDENGKCLNEKDFIYFSNLTAKGVKHQGDNLTGAGEGDDEVIEIDLSQIDESVKVLDLHIVIYKGEARKQNFGQIANSFARVVNADSNEELIRYDLGEDYSVETMVNVAKLYRHNGEWKFNAIGQGSQGGFTEILKIIGLGE